MTSLLSNIPSNMNVLEMAKAVTDARNNSANHAFRRRNEARVDVKNAEAVVRSWERVRDSTNGDDWAYNLSNIIKSPFVDTQEQIIYTTEERFNNLSMMACSANACLVDAQKCLAQADARLATWEHILATEDTKLTTALLIEEQIISDETHHNATSDVKTPSLSQDRRCPNDDIDGRQCMNHPELYIKYPDRTGILCRDLHFNPSKDEFQRCCNGRGCYCEWGL